MIGSLKNTHSKKLLTCFDSLDGNQLILFVVANRCLNDNNAFRQSPSRAPLTEHNKGSGYEKINSIKINPVLGLPGN